MMNYFQNILPGLVLFITILFTTNARSTNPEPVQFRLLVSYTPQCLANVANIRNWVDYNIITLMNKAYLNSVYDSVTNTWDQNVAYYPVVQLAGIHGLDYTVDFSGSSISTHLVFVSSTTQLTDFRTNYAADMVCIITENGSGRGQAAGIPASNAAQAFFAARRDVSENEFTAVHESGHLLGGMHAGPPYYSPHGYQFGYCQETPFIFCDIMSLNYESRKLFFSNPYLNYWYNGNGYPRGTYDDGVDDSYVTKTLSDNSNAIASFLNPISTVNLDGNDTIGDDEYGDVRAENVINLNDGFFVRQNGKFQAALTSYPGLSKKAKPLKDPKLTKFSGLYTFKCGFFNPERGIIKIAYTLPREVPVWLQVVDVQGRQVFNKAYGTQIPGAYIKNIFILLHSGLYITQITAGESYRYSQKILIK
jgi:hypothetical protein